MAEETERIYVIPLKNKGYTSSKAAPTAMKRVKQYLTRHMKVAEADIWIDESLNRAIWSRGKYKMPSKIRVKAVRFEDGVVEAYLPELEFTKSRREILQEERAKKQPILRKEEEAEEEIEEETGAEDYDVVPGPDGEVKIKKKKPSKKEEETEEEQETDIEDTEAEAQQDEESEDTAEEAETDIEDAEGKPKVDSEADEGEEEITESTEEDKKKE